MLKYKTTSIVEAKSETDKHTIYVQIFDDAKPEKPLTTICLPYVDDTQFEEELLRKTRKYLATGAGQSILADKVEAILTRASADLDATKAAVLAEKVILSEIQKEKP
jgi:hypothetical protein